MTYFGSAPARKSCSRVLLGLLAVCMTAAVLTSCATPSPLEIALDAYSRGDDVQAIQMALEALEEEPGSQEAQQVLSGAWNRAVSRLEAEIAAREFLDSPWEAVKALPYYNQLIALHRMVYNAGKTELNPDPEGVLERGLAAQSRIADVHEREGSVLLSHRTRDTAREALAHFQQVKRLNPESDIDWKIARAREFATLKLFIFTGPDTNFFLNSNDMVPAIEAELAKLDLVEIVTVPNRFAAPIGDTHGAEDFARGHGAHMMLHVVPDTVSDVKIIREKRPIHSSVSADWEIETVSLKASASTSFRFVLVDLETDEAIAEDTFTYAQSDDGGFSVSAILHTGRQVTGQLGDMSSSRSILVNPAAPGTNAWELSSELSRYERLDVSSGFAPGVFPALYSTFEQIDISSFQHPSELARIQTLNKHTFWLFDAVEFSVSSGNNSYTFVYGSYLGDGSDGMMASAAYDRRLYNDIISWMSRRDIRQNMENQFLPSFYTRDAPRAVAGAAAPLLK